MTTDTSVCEPFAARIRPTGTSNPEYETVQLYDVDRWRIWMHGEWVICSSVFGRWLTRDDIGRRIYRRANVLVPETDLDWADRLARDAQQHFDFTDPPPQGEAPDMGTPTTPAVLELVAGPPAVKDAQDAITAAIARIKGEGTTVNSGGPGVTVTPAPPATTNVVPSVQTAAQHFNQVINGNYTPDRIMEMIAARKGAFVAGWHGVDSAVLTYRRAPTEENLVWRFGRLTRLVTRGGFDALDDLGDLSGLPE